MSSEFAREENRMTNEKYGYATGRPPSKPLAQVRVIAPKNGNSAIILGSPWEVWTHPVPADLANPKRGIMTKGCRGPGCPHCGNDIRREWRAYFPAWAIAVAAGKHSISNAPVVLTVTAGCFEQLESLAYTQEHGTSWRGLYIRFRRGEYNQLSAEPAEAVPHLPDGRIPARPFLPEIVVLRAWNDPRAAQFEHPAGRAGAAGAEPTIVSIAEASRAQTESLIRFDALPEPERARWLAEAKGDKDLAVRRFIDRLISEAAG